MSGIIWCLAFAGCDKDMTVDAPEFEVYVKSEVCKAGEPVVFGFRGDADNIAFFSGEDGYRDEQEEGNYSINALSMSFSTYLSNMAGGKKVERRVLVSSDFNGNHQNPYAVLGANWVDITDKFTLANKYELTASGEVDITKYRKEGEKLHIAFMYKDFPFDGTAAAPCWQILKFSVYAHIGIEKKSLADFSQTQRNAGFKLIGIESDGDNPLGSSEISSSRVILTGNSGPRKNTSEIWAISSAIEPFEYQADANHTISIKCTSDEMPAEYSYTYEKPGLYQLTFIAKNVTSKDCKTVTKTIELLVE